MNWIFEAYASVYQTATGLGHSQCGHAAPAKKSDYSRHDAESVRR